MERRRAGEGGKPLDIGEIRRKVESFRGEAGMEWYRGGAGLKDRVDMAAVFGRHPGLFSRESVDTAASALAASEDAGDAGPGEGRRLRQLRGFLTVGFIREALKELSDAAVNFEMAARVRVPGGGKISYRQSQAALLNEADRGRRAALESARMEVVARKSEFLVPIHERTHEMAAGLGFADYLGMMGELKSFPLAPVRDEMRAFLADTRGLYEEKLSEALEAGLGISLAGARRHDLQRLFRGREHDALFPAERMVPAAREFCASMGLDLEAGGKVRLDIEARPRKSPRAFCSAVRVPGEVYLVISPRGGHDDYRAFLHELGHALHYAGVDPGAPLEAKRLGDNSVTEAFAMLFDHLLLNPSWLAGHLGGSGADYAGFLRAHALFELFMLRRYAAKIGYELGLHDGASLEGEPARYARALGEATLAATPGESYLDDVDPFFYCASYLRAWMLQAQLAERLRERFGAEWWRSRESGEFLAGLWRAGQAEDGDALSRRLGFERLSAKPLAEEIEGLIRA